MLWNDLTALINNPELCYADFAMGANLEMTVAALLVYAAFADYKMDEREIGVIRDLTRRRFGFDDFVLENLIINAQLTEGHELQMEKFIKTLKKPAPARNPAILRGFMAYSGCRRQNSPL